MEYKFSFHKHFKLYHSKAIWNFAFNDSKINRHRRKEHKKLDIKYLNSLISQIVFYLCSFKHPILSSNPSFYSAILIQCSYLKQK